MATSMTTWVLTWIGACACCSLFFLPCELVMFASCHLVEMQPLVVEERWGLLLGRLQSLWNCQEGFVVLECSRDGMWVLKESCSSFPLLNCFWKGRHFDTGASFSRGHVLEFNRCSCISQRMRPSLGLCLESRLGQNRCVEGVEPGCMGGSLWVAGMWQSLKLNYLILDINLHISGDCIRTSIHYKATDTHSYLHYNSSCNRSSYNSQGSWRDPSKDPFGTLPRILVRSW